MVGSTLVEVCGGLIFSFTRSVAEHVNSSETEFNSELFGYDLLECTGVEWYCQPVDELICQEYSDQEVTSTAYLASSSIGYGQARLINACSTENSEDHAEEPRGRAMAWKSLRPSLASTAWNSVYFGFLISVLSSAIVGIFSILFYYVYYQTVLICRDRAKEAVPIKIQWYRTVSEIIACTFLYLWYYLIILFCFRPYQIMALKRKLFLISFVFYVLDSLNRGIFQALGISHSEMTFSQKIPGNVFFVICICVQAWILARHFCAGAGTAKKFKTMLLLMVPCEFGAVACLLVAYFIYPEYNKQSKAGRIIIAVFTPLITVVVKSISRLCVQRLWRVTHPGTSFALLAPQYYGWAVMLRLLQVDLGSLKSIALIGVIHGVAEVIERSVAILIDYIHHQIYERRRVPWGSFRTPRRERLAADIAILSMLLESSAVISVNGFLHLHEHFYTDKKTPLQLLQSFAITTSVPLAIEWFFASVSIAIETRLQNRPVIAVWRRQWKRHLNLALINALPIVAWTSTNLLIAVQARFSSASVKDYCENPFSHP